MTKEDSDYCNMNIVRLMKDSVENCDHKSVLNTNVLR